MHALRRLLDSRLGLLALQLAAIILMVGIDLGVNAQRQPRLIQGLIDLPFHLLTALVVLSAVRCGPFTPFWWSAAAWSVLIDVDHLPGELGSKLLSYGEPRPYPHSLLFIGLLCLAARARDGTFRQIFLGAAAGSSLELLRDITDGGRIPLFWPLITRGAGLPYPFYVFTLLAFAFVGLLAARPEEAQDVTTAADQQSTA